VLQLVILLGGLVLLLITANVVPSAPIVVTLIMEAIQKKTPWPLVRKRTIPTERPPLVDEI
jgi:hypothetical protein